MNTITLEHIISIIEKDEYFNNEKTTVCILTLKNGFEVVGTSGVVDKSNFDEGIGREFAKKKAIEKIWELEGYRLQCELAKK